MLCAQPGAVQGVYPTAPHSDARPHWPHQDVTDKPVINTQLLCLFWTALLTEIRFLNYIMQPPVLIEN